MAPRGVRRQFNHCEFISGDSTRTFLASIRTCGSESSNAFLTTALASAFSPPIAHTAPAAYTRSLPVSCLILDSKTGSAALASGPILPSAQTPFMSVPPETHLASAGTAALACGPTSPRAPSDISLSSVSGWFKASQRAARPTSELVNWLPIFLNAPAALARMAESFDFICRARKTTAA